MKIPEKLAKDFRQKLANVIAEYQEKSGTDVETVYVFKRPTGKGSETLNAYNGYVVHVIEFAGHIKRKP